jgi:hypothetical protein
METFAISDRPPALPVAKTYIYKTVGEILIPIDVYLPRALGVACPIMLFIHGGGWLGGSRSNYCRPLFRHLLSLGSIVTSMDYRLLPETSLAGQLEDVRDVESWSRHSLPSILTDPALSVDEDNIVVVGASAGSLLAFLTVGTILMPEYIVLTRSRPNYGESNRLLSSQCTDQRICTMSHLSELVRFSILPPLLPTPELLAAATTFESPPTEIAPPKIAEDYMRPRALMGRKVFTKSLIAEFLIKRLLRDESGALELPEKGSVSEEQIDAISKAKA